MLVPHSTQKLF